MDFLIITGLSGAGKSRAVDALEDIGFYCVDNIPPQLIPTFCTLCRNAKEKMEKVAVVTDVRGGDMFGTLFASLEELKEDEEAYKILFLDASDRVLINRYKETRRRHPLSEETGGSIEKAVRLEREMLRPVREKAD